ncbi:MAG TPA: PadR family transcriptional regulator [Verrucomicrobiae bacterium]|nr:PadR family transcriptional regulator [Verrucomicrobiae bacterium]
MDTRQLYSGLIRLHILHHAAREGIFGLGMIEELARHGYKLSPGTLYPVLHGLEQNGLLRSEEHNLAGKIRRVYRATPAGQRVLKAAKEQVRELFGELFEVEPLIELPRTRTRVVALQAANYRKRRAGNATL